MVASDLNDGLVAEAFRRSQPASNCAAGRHDVARKNGHVVVQAGLDLESLELSV